MKINLLDAGLRDTGGHHFDHDRSLVRHLCELGHEVSIYGGVHMQDDVIAAFTKYGRTEKLFRANHYARLDWFDLYAGELVMFDQQRKVIAEDLRRVGEADLWLWPSLRAQQLYACAAVRAGVPVVGCIHEDPGIEERSIGAMIWRLAILKAHQLGLRHTLGTVEPELRHRFMEIIPDGRFAVFPHPYDGKPIEKPKSKLRKIGFFGHHRPDKGTKMVGLLIERLVNDGYEVLFQDSAKLTKNISHPRVQVLEYVEDLSVPISSCDLVVLPYDVEGYRDKGSGILATCLIAGVPVIGPYGTIPGRLIEQYNVGPLFTRTRSDRIYAAIKIAERNFGEYAKNAFDVSRSYSRRNGTANYVKTVMTCAKDAQFMPSPAPQKQRRVAIRRQPAG